MSDLVTLIHRCPQVDETEDVFATIERETEEKEDLPKKAYKPKKKKQKANVA